MIPLLLILTSFVCGGILAFFLWCHRTPCHSDKKSSELKQTLMEDCQALMDIKMQTFIEEMLKIFLRIHDHSMTCILHNPIHLEEKIHGMKICSLVSMNLKEILVFDCNGERVPFKIVDLPKNTNGVYFFDTTTEMIVVFDYPMVFKIIEFVGLDVDNFSVYDGVKVQFFASLATKHSIGMTRISKEKNIICNTAITYHLIQ